MGLDVNELVDGVLSGNRTALGRAITLVESTHPDHREQAGALLDELDPHSRTARRIGITGVPGVGKSTFIDGFGSYLTGQGHRVAVLAVDPSSTRSGGSILGDKTRMERLATDPNAFIRPSPSAGTLGGVARATRSALVVLAAAGYDVLFVETVGVGQSETTVSEMTDTFLLLALARTGDSLQGIKKGVLELANVIAVNKADGPGEADARVAARELHSTLKLLGDGGTGWIAPVLTCSGLTDQGLPEVWDALQSHLKHLQTDGRLDALHRQQRIEWMWATVRDDLDRRLGNDPKAQALGKELQAAVEAGDMSPVHAADRIVDEFLR